MPDDLAQLLQQIVDQAAESTPKQTGTVARFAHKIDTAETATVVLADVSGSMRESAGQQLKIDVLREAMSVAVPPGAVIIAFASMPRVIDSPALLPAPSGGTALHLALDEAAKHRPRHTLVITDGRPDLPEAALQRADALSGTLDVIYCGPDDDAEALLFVRQLARAGGGRAHIHDIRQAAARQALAPTIRAALEAPGKR
jgi:hypothetical protein